MKMKFKIRCAVPVLASALFLAPIVWDGVEATQICGGPRAMPKPEPISVRQEAEQTIQDQCSYDVDAVLLAQLVAGEGRYCTRTNQAAVMWCVLHRVDSPDFPDDVFGVVSQPGQFHGWDYRNPADPELLELAGEVLSIWRNKTPGCILPARYLYFWGDGAENHFTTEPCGGGVEWDWKWGEHRAQR